MDEQTALELIRLADGDEAVSVWLVAYGPTRAPDDWLADIVITGGFVGGRLRIVVSVEDLDHWMAALDRIEADGRGPADGNVLTVDWPPAGNDGFLRLIADDPIVVEVYGQPQTRTSASVPLDLDEGWITEARRRMRAVRELAVPKG
ncbi:DUF5959 family protein [Streptomyces xanthophaeus]